MINIDLDPIRGKFIVTGGPADLDYLRTIPNRRFDKGSRSWVCAPTRKNIEYFRRLNVSVSDPAAAAMRAVEKGPQHKAGVLPAGFNFKTIPRKYQLECLLRGLNLEAQALLMDPGTGKTKIMIDDCVASYLAGKINAVIVVCPNSIKGNWLDELDIHSPGHVAFIWEPDKKKAFERFMMESAPALKWLIIGVESFSQGAAPQFAEKFACLHRTAVLLDESSKIANHDSIRTNKVIKLGRLAVRRRIATGTPFDRRGFNKAWAQYEFLDPNILDQGYYAFRNHFCLMGGYKGKEIIACINKDEFIDMIAPHTYRANKYECLAELPPKVYQTRRVQPTPEMKRIYEELRSTGLAESNGKFVTYNNTLVRDLRLQQVCGGFVALEDIAPPEDPTEEQIIAAMDRVACAPIDGPNPKVDEILACLDEIEGHKAIVWCRFRAEIGAVAAGLRKVYGDKAVVEFHGGVPREQRDEARRSFQQNPDVLFFVGQVSTGGIGITLTEADYVFYLSNAWSLEDRIQSEDRNHRIGQKASSVTYIDITIAHPAGKAWVDTAVLNALKSGKDYTEVLLAEVHDAVR